METQNKNNYRQTKGYALHIGQIGFEPYLVSYVLTQFNP